MPCRRRTGVTASSRPVALALPPPRHRSGVPGSPGELPIPPGWRRQQRVGMERGSAHAASLGGYPPCPPVPERVPPPPLPACSQGRKGQEGEGGGRREEEGMGVLSVPLLQRQNRGCRCRGELRRPGARWATLCRSNLRAPRGQPPPPPPPPPWVRPSSPPPAGLASSSLIPLVPLSVRLVRLRPSGLQVGNIGKVILL